MVEKLTTGKNALWEAYQDAPPLVKEEILLELKKKNLKQHFYHTASKAGYNLLKAQGQLSEIFIRLLPETIPLFGLSVTKPTSAKKPKPVEGTLSLFE